MITGERDVVAALERAIAQRVGEPRYKLWFERNTRLVCRDEQLTVGVPNRHFQEWLEKTFRSAVSEAAEEVFARPTPVRFVIDPELFQAARRSQAEVRDQQPRPQPSPGAPPPAAEPAAPPERPVPAPQPARSAPARPAEKPAPAPRAARAPGRRPRRWRKLSELIVGPCNRVAHASALSVVEAPGEGANPLVLHGPVGTGKTHLLEGIYAGLRRAHPDWRVCYLTSEDFTNRFLQAMHHDRLGSFRKQVRECDVLLVDDLNFLAKKRATQVEFLHTFDVLLADGRQVVLTCDCHPRLADDFSPELTDRLLGGVIWGLLPPDADTRLAILRARAVQAGEALPDDVLAYLADQLRGNVRELEGALHSVRHYSRVTSRPVTVPLVREALSDLLRHAVRVVHLADIDAAICTVLRLERGALQSKQRAWAVSHPRMVAMFLARRHTAASYGDIGTHFGGRNHSTAVAAEKKVRQWLLEDTELSLGQRRLRVRELVERVERELFR